MPETLVPVIYNPNFARPLVAYFEINGVRMPTPSNYNWIFPAVIGINGAGKQRIYPFWGITLAWDYLSINEFNILYQTYLGSTTGSTQVFLPLIYAIAENSNPWDNTIFTGTLYRDIKYQNVIVDAPTAQATVDNIALQGVKMTIRRITGPASPAQSPP